MKFHGFDLQSVNELGGDMKRQNIFLTASVIICLLSPSLRAGVVFEDDFDEGLACFC